MNDLSGFLAFSNTLWSGTFYQFSAGDSFASIRENAMLVA